MSDLEYLKRLREEARGNIKRFLSDEQNREWIREIRNHDGSHMATYLYIRAFDGDDGSRPTPTGIPFWLSPDVELYDASGPITGLEIMADNTYNIQVTVSNGGDHVCNSCNVELFLSDPSLGFTVGASKLLGLQSVTVLPHSQAVVNFPFETTADLAGHKCLFARVSSLTTNDYSADLVNLDTYADRHIGQQNLVIIPQSQQVNFFVHQLVGQGGRELEIHLKADKNAIKKNERLMGRFAVTRKRIKTTGFRINQGGVIHKLTERKRVIRHPFGEGVNQLHLEIPDLGLTKGEAAPYHLQAIDPQTGQVIGGITIVVIG